MSPTLCCESEAFASDSQENFEDFFFCYTFNLVVVLLFFVAFSVYSIHLTRRHFVEFQKEAHRGNRTRYLSLSAHFFIAHSQDKKIPDCSMVYFGRACFIINPESMSSKFYRIFDANASEFE